MKALSTARRKLAALRRRMTILNLSDGTGAVFPVLGDDRYGHSTAQRYLACQDLREKTRPRFGPLLATAERLAREHGMAMLSNLRVDPAIESNACGCPGSWSWRWLCPARSKAIVRLSPGTCVARPG